MTTKDQLLGRVNELESALENLLVFCEELHEVRHSEFCEELQKNIRENCGREPNAHTCHCGLKDLVRFMKHTKEISKKEWSKR